ncbi:LysM peptidoglycan-binding domain-containing protein [Taibaiella soli]|nr:LysM peptidoglycan-binding domain-containing protein [Taibaiella soli]
MYKFLFAFVFCCICFSSRAQKNDSLFVVSHDNDWMLKHAVKPGETVFSIARRYHVPPAMLADANQINYQDNLADHKVIYVPLGAYNKITKPPVIGSETRPLFRHVKTDDQLSSLARIMGVSQRSLQEWNHLPDNAVTPGSTLLIGWIMYDATDMQLPVSTTPKTTNAVKSVASLPIPSTAVETTRAVIPADTLRLADTMVATPKSNAMALFDEQTSNGQNITTEKGAAVFFDGQSKSKGEPYFAFFNNAPKGTIIKVFNPGNEKVIYVKVLGPMPQTKQYYNALIGISSYGRNALGVNETKVWCELSYRP